MKQAVVCLSLCSAVAICLAGSASAQVVSQVVIDTTARRHVGGVGTLHRARYFNHWGNLQPPTSTNLGNLFDEVTSPTGLNSLPGRDTWEFDAFVAKNLSDDPANPGFFKHSDLVARLQDTTPWSGYRWFVESGSRYQSLRDHPNPVTVQSGRAGGAWPSWLTNGTTLPISRGGAAYAEFLKTYLEEVVYGTGPNQGYLPFNKDEFYVEIMNEPQWEGVDWSTVIQMHREVTERVKQAFPQAQIGGASCCSGMNLNPLNDWDRMRQMMDDMTSWSAEFDFWSFHAYDRYSVKPDGSYLQDGYFSPGRLNAIMDLYESYSNLKFGETKRFAITEYGSWNRTEMADGSYGTYDRKTQQWDLVRDVREKLMVFLDRPDRMINATPFIATRDWRNDIPTNPAADNVFWEQDATGNWHETIVASLYRMYNEVEGEYIPIVTDNIDLQTAAFRNGNEVFIILNNLEKSTNTANLHAITGLGQVVSATIDRMFWAGTEGLYFNDLDVTGSWQNIVLQPEEGAVLKLVLDGPTLFNIAYDETTTYSSITDEALNPVNGKSSVMSIPADLQDAITAKLRIAYTRTNAPAGESFDVIVNGNVVTVPATGVIEYDDSDTDMIAREVTVPLNLLVDGSNNVQVDFSSGSGKMVSTVLVVTRTVGDFNNSGLFDPNDVSLLAAQFGPASPGSRYDLNGDGIIDFADVQHLVQNLRGTLLEDLDLDGFVGIQDLNLILSNWNSSVNPGDTAMGDPSGDGFVGIEDLNLILGSWNAGTPPPADVLGNVPEPATVWLLSPLGIVAITRHKAR